MALITEQDRVEEFENICEILEKLEIAGQVLQKNDVVGQTCLLVSLPTDLEDWSGEQAPDDLHLATGYLLQLGEEENQQTKYLLFYMPVQVDVSGLDELTRLRYVNEVSRTFPCGSCFCAVEEQTNRMLVQVKVMVGGYVEDFLDEGVVCELIYEMGSAYDKIKTDLLEMTSQNKE